LILPVIVSLPHLNMSRWQKRSQLTFDVNPIVAHIRLDSLFR
jgi:hypothetical protein